MSRFKRHRPGKQIERDEPKKRGISKQAIWTIILGGIMVFSVFGIMFSSYNSGSDKTTYGNYEFERTTNGWATEINGKYAEFNYLPSDIEKLNLSREASDVLAQSKAVYITFNPNTRNVQTFELMRFELSMKMAEAADVYPMLGVSEENDEYRQPLVDCRNSTPTVPVLNLLEGNETRAYLDGNCIIVEADRYSAPAMKDRLLYALLGIMS